MTTRDAARVEAGRQQASRGVGLVALLVTMNIVLTYELGVFDSVDQMDIIKQQTQRRVDPTGSPHAYENYKCTEFADDAMEFFKRAKKNPRRIRYDSVRGKTMGDPGNIMAADGFGLYGGHNISIAGYHEGVLVNGVVLDNNVPFGVPREMWENGYLVATRDTWEELTLRQAADRNYGTINVR